MRLALAVAFLVTVVMIGSLVFRGLVRRFRRLRRLDGAQSRVEKAMANGRLAADTGEALMQHLDGLRRICARGGGS